MNKQDEPQIKGRATERAHQQAKTEKPSNTVHATSAGHSTDEVYTSEASKTQSAPSNNQAEDVQSAQQKKHVTDSSASASFLDSFAACEDLFRFQEHRFKAMVSVCKAEFVLARKALFVSISITLAITLIALTIWCLLNAMLIYAIVQFGLAAAWGIALALLINIGLMLLLVKQLSSAVDRISLGTILDLISSK